MKTWTIDPAHSEVQFKVKHLVISTVTGDFKSFTGNLEANGEEFEGAKISFEADVNSIETGVEQRDQHLKSDDFFNAEKFPKLTFTGTSLSKKSDSSYQLIGDLTIRNITKTITLAVEFGGTMVDPYGNTKAGFEVQGKINRKEFGLQWNAVTEAGGVVVADEVKLIANIQFQKAA